MIENGCLPNFRLNLKLSHLREGKLEFTASQIIESLSYTLTDFQISLNNSDFNIQLEMKLSLGFDFLIAPLPATLSP